MKVALDLEDVLVGTNSVFMQNLNSFLKENHPEAHPLSRPDVAEWRYPEARKLLAELQDWKEEHEKKFFFGDSDGWEGYHPITERIWKESPESYEKELENTVETVKKLREIVDKKNGELALVTARENVKEGILNRIEQLGIREYLDEIIIETEKQKLNFDVYIDDYPFLYQNLEDARQIMVDQPWNRAENLQKPHLRVDDLEEAVEVIKNLG